MGQASVNINLNELRKMQKDHDGELNEIDEMVKEVGETVQKLSTASGKKNLVREINSSIGKVKGFTSKARAKQTQLSGIVDECEKVLGDHPEMIKCKDKHQEQIDRLKDNLNLLEKYKDSIGKVNTNNEIALMCGHVFSKEEFAE